MLDNNAPMGPKRRWKNNAAAVTAPTERPVWSARQNPAARTAARPRNSARLRPALNRLRARVASRWVSTAVRERIAMRFRCGVWVRAAVMVSAPRTASMIVCPRSDSSRRSRR